MLTRLLIWLCQNQWCKEVDINNTVNLDFPPQLQMSGTVFPSFADYASVMEDVLVEIMRYFRPTVGEFVHVFWTKSAKAICAVAIIIAREFYITDKKVTRQGQTERLSIAYLCRTYMNLRLFIWSTVPLADQKLFPTSHERYN